MPNAAVIAARELAAAGDAPSFAWRKLVADLVRRGLISGDDELVTRALDNAVADAQDSRALLALAAALSVTPSSDALGRAVELLHSRLVVGDVDPSQAASLARALVQRGQDELGACLFRALVKRDTEGRLQAIHRVTLARELLASDNSRDGTRCLVRLAEDERLPLDLVPEVMRLSAVLAPEDAERTQGPLVRRLIAAIAARNVNPDAAMETALHLHEAGAVRHGQTLFEILADAATNGHLGRRPAARLRERLERAGHTDLAQQVEKTLR